MRHLLLALVILLGTASTAGAATILFPSGGGTGWGNIQANSLLIGNGTGRLATTTQGTGGHVLAWLNGTPTWVATSSIQNITLTTTGSSGASTLVGNTLNIPQYSGTSGLGTTSPWTGSGVAYRVSDGAVSTVGTTTLSGTANQLSVSNAPVVIGSTPAVLSLPSHVAFPGSYVASSGSTTNATSTELGIVGSIRTSTGAQSISPSSRLLYSSGGAGVVDWENFVLQDGGAVNAIVWGSRTLNNNAGQSVLDWQNLFAIDSTGANSIDWASRALMGSDGVTPSINWATPTALIFPSYNCSGNANTGKLTTDASGNVVCADDISGGGGGSDPFTHPATNQSATTSLMLLFGKASTSQLTATSSAWFATEGGVVGIGSTSPGSLLSIGTTNGINFFGGASTTATSTIPGNIDTGGQLTFNAFGQTNIFKNHRLGFFDIQRTGTDFTLARIRAPKGDSNEATLSLVVDLSVTDSGVDEEFVDFYNERYEDAKQWGLRQAYSGAGIAKPFVIGHWNTAAGKDAGNKLIILPNGTVGITQATSTIDTTSQLYVASSTASFPFIVDAAPGSERFSVSSTGTTTITGATTATSSIYAQSTASGKGGVLILEDVDGAGCTEVSALNGVLSAKTVTCP